MIHRRKAFTIYEDDVAYTYMKPLSNEHKGRLVRIYEDAYGDMNSTYVDIDEVIGIYVTINEDIQKMINDLNETFDDE